MFHIVLIQPEIPPNTGNIIRLSANTGCTLHLIEPLGFLMDNKLLRRAGLDYHEFASVQVHADWLSFLQTQQPDPQRLFGLSSKGQRWAHTVSWQAGDYLLFGSETSGLPPAVRENLAPTQLIRLPMRPGQRSLNLSNAVAITVFEAWRQHDFKGGT